MTARALEYGIVIRIRMACGAHVIGICMTRRKWRVLRVIERSSSPSRCVVAILACRWEELRLRFVARICRVVVVRLMAADARCRQSRVVVIDMTIGAHPRRYKVRAR